MGPFPSLLGMMVFSLGVIAVATLAQEPRRPAPPPAPASDTTARRSSRLAALPAPAFPVRFSLN